MGRRSRGNRSDCNHLGKVEKKKSPGSYCCVRLSTVLKGLISKCLGDELSQRALFLCFRRVLCFTCVLRQGGKAGWITACAVLLSSSPGGSCCETELSWRGLKSHLAVVAVGFLQPVASSSELRNKSPGFFGSLNWQVEDLWKDGNGGFRTDTTWVVMVVHAVPKMCLAPLHTSPLAVAFGKTYTYIVFSSPAFVAKNTMKSRVWDLEKSFMSTRPRGP